MTTFQSQLGAIKTPEVIEASKELWQFQSQLGAIKTGIRVRSIRIVPSRFNPNLVRLRLRLQSLLSPNLA